MAEQFPTFRYHSDPLATGSVEASDVQCRCCGRSRGFIYVGPTNAEDELDDCPCPWCIASAAAHERFGVEFVDPCGVEGYGADRESLPPSVVAEVATRTPGFTGWQEERWWRHCGDAADFIGLADGATVRAHGAATVEHLRRDLGWTGDAKFRAYIDSLTPDGQPTAYLFRCLVCGEVGGYSDFT